MKLLIVFIIIILSLSMVFASEKSVAEEAIISVCTADTEFAGLTASRACDSNRATDWYSANVPYPHYLQVNFSANSNVKEIFIVWQADAPNNIDIQTFDGAIWNTVQTFAATGCGVPDVDVFTLTNSVDVDAIRIVGDAGCANYMSIFEVKVTGGLELVTVNALDLDILLLGLYLFAIMFLFGVGLKIRLFHILAGIATILISFEIFRIVGSVPLTTIFMAIGAFILIIGISSVRSKKK